MIIKPGYRTSEFWFTLVTFIFSGLYLLGIIGDISQKDELISIVSHAVESCILIGGQLIVLYKYISSREEVKRLQTLSEETEEVEEVIAKKSPNRRKKNESNRSTKTRTRKPNSRKQSGTK
jgi:hypothetical protein